MTDPDIAKLLLQMLDQASFPGTARKAVNEIATWLEHIRDGKRITTFTDDGK